MRRALAQIVLLLYLTGLYGSGFGRKAGAGVLEWAMGKAETKLKKPAAVYVALCTVEVKESNTGSTITEVSYTTYARLKLEAADISEATEAQPSVIEWPLTEKTFAAVTAGGGTVVSWAVCTALTVGDVITFGQCSSTVLSTTQTPPTVSAKAMKAELKAT